MSRFTVRRSLKQLYIEKHAVQYFIASKKADMAKGYKPTVQELADLQSEESFLKEITKDIELAEGVAKRNTDKS